MFLIIFINLFILNVNVRYKAMTRPPILKLSSWIQAYNFLPWLASYFYEMIY